MKIGFAVLFFALLLAPSARAQAPNITRVHVKKSTHTLELYEDKAPYKTYRVALGPGGAGPKHREGDKVTPTGRYFLGGAIPSRFHRFMWVSYPNDADKKRFDALKAEGKLPKDATIGGDIGVHGVGSKDVAGVHKNSDWTLGCIALDDDEIDEIARLVKPGTPIDIED